MTSQACINPNPDISGVGVRVSIYIQAFLNLASVAMFARDGFVSSHDYKMLVTSSNTLFLTGCAIVTSAIIQETTYGLSVYHALIVLNLSWINALSAVQSLLIGNEIKIGIGIGIGKGAVRDDPPVSGQKGAGSIFFRCLLLSIAHLTLLGILGVWIWTRIHDFGNQPECTSRTFLTVFGHDLPVTNQSLRKGSIGLYSIILVPIINVFTIFIIAFLVTIPIALIGTCCSSGTRDESNNKSNGKSFGRVFLLYGVAVMILLEILFVVDTELMISRSSGLVKEGEAQWTFGQTLTMFMTIFPLIEVAKGIYKSYTQRKLYCYPARPTPRARPDRRRAFGNDPPPKCPQYSQSYLAASPRVAPGISNKTNVSAVTKSSQTNGDNISDNKRALRESTFIPPVLPPKSVFLRPVQPPQVTQPLQPVRLARDHQPQRL